jgi:RimJ/RimL family protein N-acetyltransferase
MVVKYYEGDRVYLSPIELADEALFRRWLNDPGTWSTLDRWLPLNEKREREFIEKLYGSESDCALGIVVKEGDRLIGGTGLHGMSLSQRAATFGIVIGEPEFRSRGYGSEVTRLMVRLGFEEFNLNRIQLEVFARNDGAVKVYEQAGFVFEGRSRQAYYRNGRYIDALRYAILRSEWESGSPATHAAENTSISS